MISILTLAIYICLLAAIWPLEPPRFALAVMLIIAFLFVGAMK